MTIRGKYLSLLIGAAIVVPAAATIVGAVLSAPAVRLSASSLAAAENSQRSFTPEQRAAVRTVIRRGRHPHMSELNFSQRLEHFAALTKALLRPRDVATPPAAAFLGNQTLISDVSSDLIGLERQADCSLTLHLGSYALSGLTPTVQLTSAIPHYEQVLHSASGVSTAGGAFTGGCVDPSSVGLGTKRGAYLGKTAQGKRFFVWSEYSTSHGTNGLYSALLDADSTSMQPTSADFGLPNVVGITAGDLNGDGVPDVVGVDQTTGTIAVWLAHADGTLSAAATYTVPGATVDAAVIADVNGDGKLDVVAASRDSNGTAGTEHVSVLTGKGDGTLNLPQTVDAPIPTGAGATPAVLVGLIAADVRGRGHPDLVGSNGMLLLNNGTGTFTVGTAAFPATVSSSGYGPNLAAADFDKDGKLDLAVDDGAAVRIFKGQGDGSFTAGATYASTSAVGYLTAADLDGDGNLDLYVGLANGGAFDGDQYERGQGYALMGNGDGTFQGAPSLPFAYNGSNLADLNGDGRPDAVGVNSDGSFGSYLGDGAGGFASASSISASSITSVTPATVGSLDSYALGDINGDGKTDLAFIVTGYVGPGFGPGVFIANGDGHGGFATPVFYAVPSTVGMIDSQFTISHLHLADLNKDGKADLVYNYSDSSGGQNSTLYFGTVIQRSNGDGTFQAPQVIAYRSAPYDSNGNNPTETSYVALVSDLNKDGNPDLVFVAQSTTIDFTLSTYKAELQVALGHGDGTFSTPVAVAGPDILVAGRSTSPPSVAAADMNGDGIVDLVALGSSTDYHAQVAVALGTGDGTFKTPSKTTYSAQYLNTAQGLAVGDFNGDGKLDVAITDPYSSAGAGVSLGNGDGTIQTGGGSGVVLPSQLINVQADGGAMAYDFNGDGVADILAGSTLLLSQSGGTQTTPPPVTPDFALSASATASSVQAGQSATVTLTLSASGGFGGTVTFACAGLPAGASCAFAPSSVTPGASPASTTLSIATTARTAMMTPSHAQPWLPGGTLLAGFLAPVAWRRRRAVRSALLVGTMAAVALLGACHDHGGGSSAGGTTGGGGGDTSTGTPAGMSSISITATSGSLSHTVTYQLTVT